MKQFYRKGKEIIHLDDEGKAIAKESFPSINAAKRQSRHLQGAKTHKFVKPEKVTW